jgi:DNA adenine methylase
VLLRKKPARLEVYNDLFGDVVNFFTVLRDRTDELVSAIELTAYARGEYEIAGEECEDPVERARRFYVLSGQGIGGVGIRWPGGFRMTKKVWAGHERCWAKVQHLVQVAARLKGVVIECCDAFDLIPKLDGERTLFFLDPPYIADLRARSWMGDRYLHYLVDEEHEKLASVARSLSGMVVISGYDCERYDVWYDGWMKVRKSSRKNSDTYGAECLWISPAAVAGLGPREVRLL